MALSRTSDKGYYHIYEERLKMRSWTSAENVLELDSPP